MRPRPSCKYSFSAAGGWRRWCCRWRHLWLVLWRPRTDPLFSRVLLATGAVGAVCFLGQGFLIGIGGWEYATLEGLFGPLGDRQFGMGYGALSVAAAFLFLFAQGLAARGAINGDGFVVGSIALVIALVAAFIFFPVVRILASAFQDNDYNFVPYLFVEKLFSHDIWGVGCLTANVNCGIAWNSLLMAILVAASTTVLGLAFALLATRTAFRAKRLLRLLSVLPIITPPFVIGLAIILLFGASGTVTQAIEAITGTTPGRYIYGLPGIWLAQTLAFTPIAFLVLIGVVEGVSPSMEEASQTLRAGNWRTFTTVSLPLMRPGLANAFLVGFIESLADFGNPLVLGGNFDVLSTSIFFAIVGAQNDQGRAAVLAIILLAFTLTAFWAQHRWLGHKSYATVTGKGDAGLHVPLPRRVVWLAYGSALPWAGLTAVIYCMIMFGGFVELWGRDHSLTLRHYIDAFAITTGTGGLVWSGAAWNSFWTTIYISLISAPLTAAVGAAHRVSADPPKVRGPAGFRVRHHVELRDTRHRHRRRLHPGVQRAAHRAHRHRHHTGHLLHLPEHAGGRPRRHRRHDPDRQEPGRGLVDPGRQFLRHRAQGRPAAPPSGGDRRAGLQLRARHDGHQRGHLPGQRQL